MAEGAGVTDESRIVDLFNGDVGYATPKVDVGSPPSLNVAREVPAESACRLIGGAPPMAWGLMGSTSSRRTAFRRYR